MEERNINGDRVTLILRLANGETKTVETTLDILQDDTKGQLPPLMNPTMLEASDDLTNLSHLNEPAGMPCHLPHHPSGHVV